MFATALSSVEGFMTTAAISILAWWVHLLYLAWTNGLPFILKNWH